MKSHQIKPDAFSNSQALITRFFQQENKDEKQEGIHSEKNTGFSKSVKRKFLTDTRKKLQDATHNWNGYLFIANNNYSEFSVINIDPNRRNESAQTLVGLGKVIATASVDEDSALTHIEVKEGFKRKKIGSHLIYFMKSVCPQFLIYGGTQNNSRYRLTTDGAALVQYCLSKKILNEDQVIKNEVPMSPSYLY